MADLATEESQANPMKRKMDENPESSSDNCNEEKVLQSEITDSDKDDSSAPAMKKMKRKVTFEGVTVFYFRRLQGFTSVPSQGGSTLGMSSKHEKICKLSLMDYAKHQEYHHRSALKMQLIERRKIQLLEHGQEVHEEIMAKDVEQEISNLNIYDYYFLQPIPTKQRRALLRMAGIKKIDRTEKLELKRIRHSRESCGCDCKGFCDPKTCLCALAGIKCQVDRMAFPCGCTKDYCGNAAGRIEFNPVKVRAHFVETIRRLNGEYQSESDSSSVSSSPVRIPQFAGQTGLDSYMCDHSVQGSSQNTPAYMYSNAEDYSRGFLSEQFHDGYGHPSQSLCAYTPPPGYTSITPEGNVPIQIESCQSVNTNSSQVLHFNDSDEGSLVGENEVLEIQRNITLPPMPSYDSSEDSMTSSSDSSSNSDNNYQSQSISYYYDGNEYSLSSQDRENSDYFKSNVIQETVPKSPPSVKEDSEASGKTYTELTQSSTLPSFSFSQFPTLSSPLEGTGLPPMGSIFQSLGTQRPEPSATLTMLTQESSSTSLYSTYTMSTVANSLEERKETAEATNSISSTSSFGCDASANVGPSDGMNGSSQPEIDQTVVADSTQFDHIAGESLTFTGAQWQQQQQENDNAVQGVPQTEEEDAQELEDAPTCRNISPSCDTSQKNPAISCSSKLYSSASRGLLIQNLSKLDSVLGPKGSKMSDEKCITSKVAEVERDPSEASSDSAVFSGTEEPSSNTILEDDEDSRPPCDSSNGCSLDISPDLPPLENRIKDVRMIKSVNDDDFVSNSNTECMQDQTFRPSMVTPALVEIGATE